MIELTSQRHERFAQLAASGEAGAAAYRETYGAEGASAEVGASRLLGNVKVLERVAELQRESATAVTLDMQRRREIMAEIANDAKAKASDRINAVMADAKLAGELKGKNEKASKVKTLTLDELRERVNAWKLREGERAQE